MVVKQQKNALKELASVRLHKSKNQKNKISNFFLSVKSSSFVRNKIHAGDVKPIRQTATRLLVAKEEESERYAEIGTKLTIQ